VQLGFRFCVYRAPETDFEPSYKTVSLKFDMRVSGVMGGKKVTIKNVAALSGVSFQAVSKVINGRPDVSDATRKRVQKVIFLSQRVGRDQAAASWLTGFWIRVG
jgi:hypothetical protein